MGLFHPPVQQLRVTRGDLTQKFSWEKPENAFHNNTYDTGKAGGSKNICGDRFSLAWSKMVIV
jgi:hypothetical protein